MPDLQSPRGMEDLLPEDAAVWRHVRDIAEHVARLFDYGYISTPVVEDARVFLRTVGEESDIAQKEMYVFEDRGGDRMALRPEGTAAISRAYIEHGMGSRPQPVRLFYIGPFFRYDRPQAGRYRQLWQFGAECIGDASAAADAEIIELQHTLYQELGLPDLLLRINSIGTAETRARYTEALREHFRPHLESLSKDSQRRFETNILRILDSKEDAGHPAVTGAPSILDFLTEEDAAHFAAVQGYLGALGISYVVDPRVVRGLDYYARTVWEFEPPDAAGQSTVGAGGRYDGLMELLGGPATPAVGFATGIERIVLNLRRRELAPEEEAPVDVAMVPLGEAGPAAAMRLARALRAAGLAVRAGTPGRSLRAQLRAASNSNAAFAVILGDDEARDGVAQVKPLGADGEQLTVPFGSVADAIQRSW
ncbi:MAG: histidine--tRNA ligase [Dehalococcoidia bacterium]|nr:histidine--tRNA ligase [Dehalococcoidia bacterium]